MRSRCLPDGGRPAHAARLTAAGGDLRSPAARHAFLDRLQSNVHGIDIDAAAVALAHRAVVEQVLAITPGPVPTDFLHENVRVGDFLSAQRLRDLPQGLGLVVGNPRTSRSADCRPRCTRT